MIKDCCDEQQSFFFFMHKKSDPCKRTARVCTLRRNEIAQGKAFDAAVIS